MALDERARHDLYLRLEETIGADAAGTLMEHLPPVGWADVATKRDLDAWGTATTGDIEALAATTRRDMENLEERMVLRLEATGHRLLATFRGELHSAITDQTRTLALTLVGTMLSSSALAFAAARLA